MDWVSWLLNWLAGISQFIVGIVLGTIITGIFTWRVVLPKALANKEVQDVIKTVKEGKETIETFFESEDWKDMVTLFREGNFRKPKRVTWINESLRARARANVCSCDRWRYPP